MTGKIRMAVGIGLWAALLMAAVPPPGAAFPATPAMGKAGKLIIIGGGLASARDKVFQHWIEWAGGKEKIRLAIIPAASVEPAASGQSVAEDFIRLGIPADHVKVFPVALVDDPTTKDIDESRWGRNGFDEKLAREMSGYNSVYFVGGDQIRYQQTLVDPSGRDAPLLAEIRKIYQNGGVLGGSSAGAAIMSDPMICDGSSIEAMVSGAEFQPIGCPAAGGVRLSRGLGFFPFGLVDQHSLRRGRFGRLLVALFLLKKPLGFGIEEDTALLVEGSTVTVMGSSGVLIVDTRQAQSKRTAAGLQATNVILHLLADGDRYDVATGEFVIAPDRKPIAPGAEEFETYPLMTDIFDRNALTDIITNGLADNVQTQSQGLAFRLDADDRSGQGVLMTFHKTDQTVARYGERDGRDLYTVLNVMLDLSPLNVRIEIPKAE